MPTDRKKAENQSSCLPEQGQIVKVRHKIWSVRAVSRVKGDGNGDVHKVTLSCLSDETVLGREIKIIWEREVAPIAIEAATLPSPRKIDDPGMFDSFIAALRWSSSSAAEGDVFQAPFRGGVQIEEYQLAPVVRAAQMPQVRLLIADDVGLGKTIEAGLIAQELIHSHRATRILILCPAHLKIKWVDEMAEKFGLEFKIIDRDAVTRMRREFGPTINPWASFPRLVTSIDYLKTEHPRRLFEELASHRRQEGKGVKPWDLLILDEAHNVSPTGRKNYVRDSNRTSLMRAISEQFEHKVFLTATPHNGYRESFTGLLELLDNTRFSRGTELDKKQLGAVKVRRLKENVLNPDGTKRFATRVILPRTPEKDPMLYIDLSKEEQELYTLLNRYTESRLKDIDKTSERPTQFVLTLLKKRALSSPMALRESLIKHTDTVGVREELDIGDSLFHTLMTKEEDWADDIEHEENLEATTIAASRLCRELDSDEKSWLKQMHAITSQFANELTVEADSKAQGLIRWIKFTLQHNGKWNGERVIIFTEYLHTLEYLQRLLEKEGMSDAVEAIIGGMPSKDRESINEAFQSEDSDVRILLATDAASEGADFQRHCRHLIHYEIPWNPIRLEQRNGRIDRHGQRAPEVFIHHFTFNNHEDSEFMKRIVEKVETIRTDLGSVGALIAENVKDHALGRKVDMKMIDMDARREIAKNEMKTDPQESDDINYLVNALNKARMELGITDQAQLELLRRALSLEGCEDAINLQEDGSFTLSSVPITWRECLRFVTTGSFEIKLSFDRIKARDDERVKVIHLEHPLMRRSMATFRMQMWNAVQMHNGGLFRTTVEVCSEIDTPMVIGLGRLVLLGPEHNRLHEGLVDIAIKVNGEGPELVDDNWVSSLLTKNRSPYLGPLDKVASKVEGHLEELTSLLQMTGEDKAKELGQVLNIRGKETAKYARSLLTERMAAIRKTIKKWEKEVDQPTQLLLWETDEQQQLEKDITMLRARLAELEAERDKEPKRLQALYKVSRQRVYPVALRVLVPGEVH